MPEVQPNFFGPDEINGSTDLTNLLLRYSHYGLDVARMLALFNFQPIQNLIWDISEHTYSFDEIYEEEGPLLDISRKYNGVIESLARAKRKMAEEMRDGKKRQIRHEHETGWYRLYLESGHWEFVRDTAERNKGNRCAFDHRHPRQAWHHPTYAFLGQDRDAEVIVPLCDNCHATLHLCSRLSPPRKCPQAVLNRL